MRFGFLLILIGCGACLCLLLLECGGKKNAASRKDWRPPKCQKMLSLEGDFVSSHKKGSRILRKEQFIFLYSVGLLFTLYCSHSTDVPCSSFSEITFTSLFLRLALYACFLRILPILHIML